MIEKSKSGYISWVVACLMGIVCAPAFSQDAVDVGADFVQQGYFTARPDLRRCVSPLCGGYFVKEVNKRATRCVDGSLQAECYVASIEWASPSTSSTSNVVHSDTQLLVRGKIVPKVFGTFGKLGVFAAEAAYASATLKPATGEFDGLQNNGIVCITTPCFSYDQLVLNTIKVRSVSGVDLSGVGATQEQLGRAYAIIANGGTLIAAGVNKQVQEQAGIGVTFVANQFYFPIFRIQ